ncbi:MAG: TetR/AcrR family transcriptional regulator [Novosphingobium sp.]|nr:TetR/AcrR family transcriptional regulator [Novosphingobium sp.]
MATRRMGPANASVRYKLLDAAERVLERDGYPAVTSRNVGKEAGVDQKLVFYYFQNMEELVVATFRRRSETFLATLEGIASSRSPLRQLWELSSDRSGRLVIEFMAMATRNAALRQEVARYSARANEILLPTLAAVVQEANLDPRIISPELLNFAIAALARNLILETELGLLPDCDAISESIERVLNAVEGKQGR